MLPGCGKILWVFPYDDRLRGMLAAKLDFYERGLVLISQARPAMRFQLGGYHFASPAEACKDSEAGSEPETMDQAISHAEAPAR